MPGTWLHLTGRFFGSIKSKPLNQAEVAQLQQMLSTPEIELFIAQPDVDQRHGYAAARFVENQQGGGILIRAAALHDIGKRHAGLGVSGRVLASILIKLGVRVGGRVATYRNHGALAAKELEAIGSHEKIVTYARHHHGKRPDWFTHTEWDLLSLADDIDH